MTVLVGLPPTGHPEDCLCPACLVHDMDQHLIARGVDPAGHPVDPRIGRYIHPEDRSPGGRGSRSRSLWAPTQTHLDEAPRQGVVRVLVLDCPLGVWARFTGTDAAGRPVTLSGAVVAGPDVVDRGGERQVAVQVRPDLGTPDLVVYAPVGAYAELVDDPADYPARRRHAVGAVLGPVEAVLVLEYTPGSDFPRREVLVPSPGLLDDLVHDRVRELKLAAVWRGPIPTIEAMP